jgi:uncharacterized protein (DUF1330 family)
MKYNPSSMNEGRLVIVAILTVRDGALQLFREYEIKAAAAMARYGGAIERTFVEEAAYPEQQVREVHVVSFPNRAAFERYRSDAELNGLKELRAVCIARTELLLGRDGPDYMAARMGEG